MLDISLLVVSAFLAGAINSVAGGGTFLTFPALLMAGVPPINANATSTVAVCPGALASAYGYRRELMALEQVSLPEMLLISVVGGLAGAFLLLWTPQPLFAALVPWLLAFATALFIFGPQASAWLRRRVHMGRGTLLTVQFFIALYGGYFGGGIGILMLAALGVFGLADLHAMNGLKTLLSGVLNAVAVLTFVAGGVVFWTQAAWMTAACIAGGYAGAAIARRLPPSVIRRFIIVIAIAMTVYFFWTGT